MTTNKPDDLLTTSEAARVIGISKRRVQELCFDGRIQYTRVGKYYLITRAAAEAFAEIDRPSGRPIKS